MAVRTLEQDDVAFMYAAEGASVYEAYGATVLAWGGAGTKKRVGQLRELGIHPTGSMWCLTAGAETLHGNADLRDATCRDITGTPIVVPWLEYVYCGTPAWFGCFRHPAFRAHIRNKVRRAMAGGADGLHVDDPLGTAAAAESFGGCYCDHCMQAFRDCLLDAGDPALLREAGVESFDGFDYRDLVRRYATTMEECKARRDEIPLYETYVDWQLAGAQANLRELHALAREVAQRPVTLSANTCLPRSCMLPLTVPCTYLVCEVPHHAERGTSALGDAILAYRIADALGKPMAATAEGGDWAFVLERQATELVKVWIALSYACGHRLMAPHRAWCHTPQKGTHWYAGPQERFAPFYRFVRANGDLLRGYGTVGPLAAPDLSGSDFGAAAEREAADRAVSEGDPQPLRAGRVQLFPRLRNDGRAAVHLVNTDYDAGAGCVRWARDLDVRIPADVFGRTFSAGKLHRPDGPAVTVAVANGPDGLTARLPELNTWGILELAP